MRRLVWLGLLLVLAGCSSKNSRQVPAAGTVYLDGNPLPNVVVTFYPDDNSPGQGGFAVTDEKGFFEIEYPGNGKGLVPGTYRVIVNRQAGANDPTADNAIIDEPIRASKGIPGKYSNPEITPLRITVDASGSPLEVRMETPAKK